MIKSILVSFAALFVAFPLAAQKNNVAIEGGVELMSGYIWRGDRVCGAQVTPSLSLTWKGLTLQGFGYLALDGSYKEIDWELSYKIGAFSLHLADYFARVADYPWKEDYFNWKKGETDHILEAILCYEPENFPLAAKWFTFLYGDWFPSSAGELAGRPSFSSYLELEAWHRIGKRGRLSLFGGASVLKGAYTAYTRDFAVVHVELRYVHTLELGPVRMPLTFGYIINPYARTSFLNAGVGVKF